MAITPIESQKAFIIDVQCTQQSGTLNSNATAWVEAPYVLPQGYTAVSVSRVYVTGPNSPIMMYQFSLSRAKDIVSVAIRNIGSGQSAYTVDASVVCIKTS